MDATANARRLRQDQTLAEKAFWKLVRNRRLGGFRFLRQVPIDHYFADFVCEAGKLIVELDGATHEEREDYDERHTQTLELFGYVVVRFHNGGSWPIPAGWPTISWPCFVRTGCNLSPSHRLRRRAPPSLQERGIQAPTLVTVLSTF